MVFTQILSKLKPQKIVDTVFSGIDKAILSKEEMVDLSLKAAKMNLKFVEATKNESTPRSITRRIIAIMVLAQFFLSFNVGLAAMIMEMDIGKEIIGLVTAAFAPLSVYVIIFYFGNHILNAVLPKFANKK